MREYIKDVSHHYEGDYHKITKAINKQEKVPHYPCVISYITIVEPNYPKELLELENPPYILYYLGDIELLKLTKVSMVGSRHISEYSKRMTIALVEQLKKRYCLVSGLAKGIDTLVHTHSLDFYSIGVLGCGVDVCYPKQNLSVYWKMVHRHLLISEYPPGVKPHPSYFPFRNRIIAALGMKIYVMSGAIKSGTMHTVDAGIQLNKHILCLPHPIDDYYGAGCNRLIQEGADILTNTTDL